MTRAIWDELHPGKPWPGDESVVRALAEEVRVLRKLTDTMVTSGLDEQGQRRSYDEIQRAHDIIVQYCLEMNDEQTVRHVAPLCWVLKHDHITGFAKILAAVETRLEQLGYVVVRLPDLVDPAKEK